MRIPFWYQMLASLVRFSLGIFFRKEEVDGKELLPQSGGILFAPNHQNAFMDALATAMASGHLPYHLARADIFKKAWAARILRAIRAIPVYRQRDGQRQVAQNRAVFAEYARLMEQGASLLVFPEANHKPRYQLRPLQKGFARLALEAAAQIDFASEIWIVPTGLTYDDFPRFRQDFYLKFGPAIPVSAYKAQYLESPPLAFQALREELRKRLKPLVIDQQPADQYASLETGRRLIRAQVARKQGLDLAQPAQVFLTDQKSLELLGQASHHWPAWVHKAEEQSLALGKAGFSFRQWEQARLAPLSIMGLIGKAVFPGILGAYGWLNHLPLSLILRGFIHKFIRDQGFIASIKLVLSLVLVPLLYGLQSWMVARYLGSAHYGFLYLLTLPISAWAGIQIRDQQARITGSLKKIWLNWKKPEQWTDLLARQEQLFSGILASDQGKQA